MKTAIFLGAGASAAEGAPMQSKLFVKYFGGASKKDKRTEMYQHLVSFFQKIFHIEPDGAGGEINYPTFEEALGVLDLSEQRRESLRSFDSTTFVSNSDQVRMTRLYLILAMAKVIRDGLERDRPSGPYLHDALVKNLGNKNLLPDTVFVSTNYDLLIDGALSTGLYYGVDFVESANQQGHDPRSTPLFKIHGSLNWLYCSTCNDLRLYNSKKIVLQLIQYGDGAEYAVPRCVYCRTILSPVIVPPTYYKDMSNIFLSTIWNKAEHALRAVEHVIFCGYSFPDADMHIKYLIKRMQLNRPDSRAVRFTLFNQHPGKPTAQTTEELQRYRRFLGDAVTDTGQGFQDFVHAPESFFAPKRGAAKSSTRRSSRAPRAAVRRGARAR